MKLIVFVGDDSNQFNLVKEISSIHEIDLIVLRKKPDNQRRFVFKLLTKIRKSIVFPLNRAWFKMLETYPKLDFSEFSKEILSVESVNEEKVFRKIQEIRPALTVVSGTNLLSGDLINILRQHGEVFNLHTGLSPYVNGGPNCTNWCLYMNQFDLIGNTVMHINSGIDAGDIISTEKVDLSNIFTLKQLHVEVMRSAQDLYLKCIKARLNGIELPRIEQAGIVGPKRTFYSKEWHIKNEIIASLNFYVWVIKRIFFRQSREFEKTCVETFVFKAD